jgi:hypothetical protein
MKIKHRLLFACAATACAGAALAQVTVDGRRNEPNNSNPYGAPLAVQRSTVIDFENAPRVSMCFQSNQSNVGGKGAFLISGTQSAPDASDPALVTTGVELALRLSDLGLTSLPAEIKIAGFINGSGHDFLSNQVFRGMPGDPGNLGEPRNINFENIPGEQFIRVNTTVRSGVAPTIDGVRNESPYVVFPQQTIGTGFGSSNLNPAVRNRANGSEIDSVSAYIYTHGTPGNPNDDILAGNLETNFNTLSLFFDYISNQGQNTLLNNNPDVSFNGLNRMGLNDAGNPNNAAPGVLGPGLTFDAGFRADYWISITVGGGAPPATPTIFVDCAQLLTNGGGLGGFAGGAANLATAGSPGVFDLTHVSGPPAGGLIVDIDNSNSDAVPGSGGVGGRVNSPGSGSQPDVSPPASVTTGFEFKINLDGIGYEVGSGNPIKVAGVLLGFNYDYMSNNAIGGLTNAGNPDPDNLGFPAKDVDLRDWDGDQFVTLNVPVSLPSAVGHNINGTLDAGETGLYGSALWVNTTNAAGFGDSVATMTFTPGPHRSNGSEFNAAYFYVANDPTDGNKPKLFGLITGNLHDFNKIVLFFDTDPDEGQTDVRGDNFPIENFNGGLGGPDGFHFDDGFAADYAIVYTLGYDTSLDVARHFAYGVQLLTGGGGYGGTFGGGNKTTLTQVCGEIIAREGFGNNTLPGVNQPGAIRTVNANGSELNAVYMRVEPDGFGGGQLYMFFAGNLEPNFTSLEIFFDTRPGDGQNRLIFSDREPQDPLYTGNPDVDFGALNRMGGPVLDENMQVVAEGLRFDSDFAADYYLSFRAGNYEPAFDEVQIFGNWARLRSLSDPAQGPMPADASRFLGVVINDNFDSFGPSFQNGDLPEPIAAAALANNNTGGVPGGRLFYCPGSPSSDPATVLTGFEFVVDLADIGYGSGPGLVPYVPGTSPINFIAFLNGPGHGNISNQILQHACVNDLGEPRNVNFDAIPGKQYVGFPVAAPATGPCTQPPFPGDANNDGLVNFSDITSVLSNFGANYQPGTGVGDANNDGLVNFADITAVLVNFGNVAPSCL